MKRLYCDMGMCVCAYKVNNLLLWNGALMGNSVRQWQHFPGYIAPIHSQDSAHFS